MELNIKATHDYFWTSDDNDYKSRERFSLLLLEPGEIYFEDFSAFYYPMSGREADAIRRKQKGRLKLCSKSLVFDPLDTSYPMLKFLFKDFITIEKWKGSLLSKIDAKGDVMMIESKLCVHMRESNVIGPFKYIREKNKHLFSLNFGSLSSVQPQIEQLHRASTLNPHDEASMIASIVQSRQARISFNTSWIEDLYEKIVCEVTADKITPLVRNPGRVLLTSLRLYFQPFNNVEPLPVVKIKLEDIQRIVKRRYILRHVGLEIFSPHSNKSLYLIFYNKEKRDHFYNSMMQQEVLSLEDARQENMTLKWQAGAISNFEYLMYLNSQADRSFNDLTQYPVFPWIIADYDSDTLDLNDPKTFRDLARPIGTMDSKRLEQLKSRCDTMPEPKFLYGSHYSSPGFVLYYLVRVAPEYMLCLQNGRFDKADRMFNVVKFTWENCCTGQSDFKELIPEFYTHNGEFLVNNSNLSLGIKQDGTRVHHVQLPPWAQDAQDFVHKCREALECQYVSENIHNWIDLIFGYKQTGEEAWKADNVFYYLTYEGAIDLGSISNPNEKASLEQQILEFGQTPKQLFKSPHPPKTMGSATVGLPTSGLVIIENEDEHDDLHEDIPIVDLQLNSDTANKLTVKVERSAWQNLQTLRKTSSFKFHKDAVLGVAISADRKHVFSVSQDTQLKMSSLEDGQQVRSMNLSSMALSSCLLMPDFKTILVGSWDNNLYIYSVDYGRAVDERPIHDDAVTCLCWKENTLITASWDSTVKIWSFDCKYEGKKPVPPDLMGEMDHDTEVTAVDLFVNSNGMQVASGTKDGNLFIWNVELLIPISQSLIHTDTICQVMYSPDGQRILSCSADQYMRVLDVNTGLEIYSKDVGEPIRCAAWDGQMVLIGSECGSLMVWDLVKIECLHQVSLHNGPMRCLAVSKDCTTVVTGGSDGYLHVLYVESS